MISSVKEEMKRLFTVKETCAYLRISPPTLYRMLEREELIPVKIGKHTLFEKKDLDSFIEASKKTAKKPGSKAKAGKRTLKKSTAKKRSPRKENPEKKGPDNGDTENKVPKSGEQGELLLL